MENQIKRKVGQPRKYPEGLPMSLLTYKVPTEIKEHIRTLVKSELAKYRMKFTQTELFANHKND